MFTDYGCLVQRQVGPDGAANGKRDADQEYIPPVDGCQDTTRNQTDERAARAGDHVDAHGQAALVGGEGVRQYGGRVCHQESAAHTLHQPEDDNLHGCVVPGALYQVQHDRAHRKDGKTEVVHAHPAEHVGDAAKGHQERCSDNEVPHQHPQQVVGFSACQGINPDTVKDGR